MNTLIWSSRRKRNGNGFYGAASVIQHRFWGGANTYGYSIAGKGYFTFIQSNPITAKENTINPRDQDHVNDFPFSCSDICKNDP